MKPCILKIHFKQFYVKCARVTNLASVAKPSSEASRSIAAKELIARSEFKKFGKLTAIYGDSSTQLEVATQLQ